MDPDRGHDGSPDPQDVYRRLRDALPSTEFSRHPVDVLIQATALKAGTHTLPINWPDTTNLEYVVSDPEDEEVYATLPFGEDDRGGISIAIDTAAIRIYRYVRGGNELDDTPTTTLPVSILLNLAETNGTMHAEARYQEYLTETGCF